MQNRKAHRVCFAWSFVMRVWEGSKLDDIRAARLLERPMAETSSPVLHCFLCIMLHHNLMLCCAPI